MTLSRFGSVLLGLLLSLRSASEGPHRVCRSDEKDLSTGHAVAWLVACSMWKNVDGYFWSLSTEVAHEGLETWPRTNHALGRQCFLGNQYPSFSSLIAEQLLLAVPAQTRSGLA